MEEWRDVPGFNGKYQVSINTKEGKCRSLNLYSHKEPKLLSNTPGKRDGRINWVLRKNGKSICKQAAVWIALTYPELVEGDYFPGATIDHKDTNRLNNHPSNLRWTDSKGQQNNPLTKKHKSDSLKGKYREGKWVIQLSKRNEILHFYPSAEQAARETGIPATNISVCCNGKKYRKTAGGYIWKYA